MIGHKVAKRAIVTQTVVNISLLDSDAQRLTGHLQFVRGLRHGPPGGSDQTDRLGPKLGWIGSSMDHRSFLSGSLDPQALERPPNRVKSTWGLAGYMCSVKGYGSMERSFVSEHYLTPSRIGGYCFKEHTLDVFYSHCGGRQRP